MALGNLESIKKASTGLSDDQKLELALYLLQGMAGTRRQAKRVDLGPLYGTIELSEDALAYQKRVRNGGGQFSL